MVQKYYDTAVFGTTFLGIGAALSMENVVVIEKGGLFGVLCIIRMEVSWMGFPLTFKMDYIPIHYR